MGSYIDPFLFDFHLMPLEMVLFFKKTSIDSSASN